MKNLLFLGAVALLLFSLSAALSLWLNQSRQEAAQADKGEKGDKGPSPAPTGNVLKEPEKPSILKPPGPGPNTQEGSALGLQERQDRLERKALQLSLVVADVQSQQETTEALRKEADVERKKAAQLPPTPDAAALAAILARQKAEEEAAYRKMAAVYDAMSPEGAAPIFKQQAESGKMEQAAQILVYMQQRKSALMLEAIGDPNFVAQVMEKVRQLRAQTATPLPASPMSFPVVPPRAP